MRPEKPGRTPGGNAPALTGHRRPAIVGVVKPALSIVIPTLDAAGALGATLEGLKPGIAALGARDVEVLVVDGGSRDATRAEAARHGTRWMRTAAGRGRQLGAGGAAAAGEWLLFLHADTRLGPGWHAEAQAFMRAPTSRERAAAFRFALDDEAPAARLLERLVLWRCRLFGLPYGDQGLLIHRAFYAALRGFRPLPLMEDVDLVRRIGRRFVVWSARPIQPRILLLVRPQGLAPSIIADKSPVPNRIKG